MTTHRSNLSLVLVSLLLALSTAHFPPHCRCVCHITPDALSRSRLDCFLPGAASCRVRLCRNHNSAGFACCMPEGGAVDTTKPLTSRTPLPMPMSAPPSPSAMMGTTSMGPMVSTEASVSKRPLHGVQGTGSMTPVASAMPSAGGMGMGVGSGGPDHDGDHGADHGHGDGHDDGHGDMSGGLAEQSMEAEATMEMMMEMASAGPEEMEVGGMGAVGGVGVADMGRIEFAADDMARLYVNGEMVSSINDWAAYATVWMRLFEGDVIGIEVMDEGGKWHGVIGSVATGEGVYVTGRDEWRAIRKDEVGVGGMDWKVRGYSGCAWARAKVREGDGVWLPGKSVGFPYESGAKYVWADGVGEGMGGGGIYLRFVIGGEDC